MVVQLMINTGQGPQPILIDVPDEARFKHYDRLLYYAMGEIQSDYQNFLGIDCYKSILEYLAYEFNRHFDNCFENGQFHKNLIDINKFSDVLFKRAKLLAVATTKAISRVIQDKEILSRILYGKDSDPRQLSLLDIEFTKSDTHHGGESVLIFKFSSKETQEQKQIVYKPSSVLIDMLIVGDIQKLKDLSLDENLCDLFKIPELTQSFLEIIQEIEGPGAITLPTYLVLPMIDADTLDKPNQQYGYLEYLPHKEKSENIIRDEEILKRYSIQAGMIAALSIVLGLTDCHYENLIFSALNLLLIDLENALMPRPIDAGSTLVFHATQSGVYGEIKASGVFNSIYFKKAFRKILPYQINLEFFNNGVSKILKIIQENTEEINSWFQTISKFNPALRVVPFGTGIFSNLKNKIHIFSVLKQDEKNENLLHMIKKELLKILNKKLKTNMEIEDLTHDWSKLIFQRIISDNGTPLIFLLNQEISQEVLGNLQIGDIPIYHLYFNSRFLLKTDDIEVKISDSNESLYYFIHTPQQAFIERISILKNPQYRQFIKNYLAISLLYIHAIINEAHDFEFEKYWETTNDISVNLYLLLSYQSLLGINKEIDHHLKSLFKISRTIFKKLKAPENLDYGNDQDIRNFKLTESKIKEYLQNHLEDYCNKIITPAEKTLKTSFEKISEELLEHPASPQSDTINFLGINFTITSNEGRGNCLYHAFVSQLKNKYDHRALREKAIAHLEKHKEEYRPFFAGSIEKFNRFLENAGNDGYWADMLEIVALAKHFNRPVIILYKESNTQFTIINQDSGKTPIFLLYSGGRHYEALNVDNKKEAFEIIKKQHRMQAKKPYTAAKADYETYSNQLQNDEWDDDFLNEQRNILESIQASLNIRRAHRASKSHESDNSELIDRKQQFS